jgi:hypothetical protein
LTARSNQSQSYIIERLLPGNWGDRLHAGQRHPQAHIWRRYGCVAHKGSETMTA